MNSADLGAAGGAGPTLAGDVGAGRTLAGRLAEARARTFVGRGAELDLVRNALAQDDPPFAVLFLYGPGGIGKTALLRQIAADAEADGCISALVDARHAAGGPAAFSRALAVALGLPAEADPVVALHAGPRTVLLIDTYEEAGGLDRWLRDRFLPELPARTVVVCAGREPPASAWRSEPGWEGLVRVVALRNLPPEDARALLSARAVPADAHADVLAITGGYPLALSLIAEIVAQRGAVEQLANVPDVVAALVERFVAGVPSAAHREALQVAAHSRVTTEGLLRAAVPAAGGVSGAGEAPGAAADATALFDWLRGLSLVESHAEGLVLHDIARDVLEIDLRWRDEAAYRDLHRRVRRHIITRMQATSGAEQIRVFRDLVHLHRHNPLFTPYHTWQEDALVERSLRPDDVDELVALTAQRDGPETAALVRFWSARAPEDFVVCEPTGGGPIAGFFALLRLASPSREEWAADPVVRILADHIERHALLRPGEHVLVGRFIVSREDHGRPSPTMDLVQVVSTTRSIFPPYPAMTAVLPPGLDGAFWEPTMTYIGWPPLPGVEVEIDGRTAPLFVHDWRVMPPDAWLDVMGDREIDLGLDLEELRRQPPAVGAVLSRPEFDDAVRAALKDVARPEALAGNPLVQSRLIAGGGDADAATLLQDLLADAVDALRTAPQGDKLHRAVATTFFKGVPTQEAAAERLGVPFSTYRRHLSAGVAGVAAHLWEREVQGGGPAPP